MVGFLLMRGGVHIVAYAKALEKLTGIDVGKLLPVPDISNKRFPEARKHEAKGLHRILYRFSPEDYKEITQIWTGKDPEDGNPLEVQEGPPKGSRPPTSPRSRSPLHRWARTSARRCSRTSRKSFSNR